MSKQQVADTAPAFRLDWLKWIVVVVIFVAILVGNSMYQEQSAFYRLLTALVLAGFAGLVAAQTATGASFWQLAKSAMAELKRVAWPTAVERNRSTITVVIFILALSLVLWGLDALFGWLASLLLG